MTIIHLKRLRLILADWKEPAVTEVQRADIDALEWAIDQLRWRSVNELPDKEGIYLVEIEPDQIGVKWWVEGEGWQEVEKVTKWRPMSLPEE